MKTALLVRKLEVQEHIFSVSAWPFLGLIVLFPAALTLELVHVLRKSSKISLTASCKKPFPWP